MGTQRRKAPNFCAKNGIHVRSTLPAYVVDTPNISASNRFGVAKRSFIKTSRNSSSIANLKKEHNTAGDKTDLQCGWLKNNGSGADEHTGIIKRRMMVLYVVDILF